MRSAAASRASNLLHFIGGAVLALGVASCATSSTPAPTRLEGSSQTLTVSGEYTPVALDRIERLSLQGGTLVLHGSSTSVTVPLPAGATQPTTGDQWVLVTEAKAGDGKRTVTFTHQQSLDDFTMSLPFSDAELRYGTLAGNAEEDVLVFAWGRDSRSYWGFVKINRRSPS